MRIKNKNMKFYKFLIFLLVLSTVLDIGITAYLNPSLSMETNPIAVIMLRYSKLSFVWILLGLKDLFLILVPASMIVIVHKIYKPYLDKLNLLIIIPIYLYVYFPAIVVTYLHFWGFSTWLFV